MQFFKALVASALVVASVNAHIDSQPQQHAIRRHHIRDVVQSGDAADSLLQRDLEDSHDAAPVVAKRAKKCKNKKGKKHHSKHKEHKKKHKHHKNKDNNNNNNDNDNKKGKSEAKLQTQSGGKIFGGKGQGLMGMKFASSCPSKATADHPNGAQSFLSCGLDGQGWNPPDIKLSQVKMVSADEAGSASLFAPCKKNLWAFKQAEKNHGVPAVLLMAFAMQESTCNPSVTGGNGEQGMMQITPDKCGGAPHGNCKDVSFNVNKGAEYFKSQLNANNGNLLLAIGNYNGWYKGMTVNDATKAARQGQCHAQQNLDYVYQLLNGWLLAKSDNPYAMGKYQNLKNCN